MNTPKLTDFPLLLGWTPLPEQMKLSIEERIRLAGEAYRARFDKPANVVFVNENEQAQLEGWQVYPNGMIRKNHYWVTHQ